MQDCLDDIIDDGKFLSVVKERLSEWDGDTENDQFIAVWSAADYRLKYYNTLADGKEKIEQLMKAFEDVGFIPQFDVCGPPTIEIPNLFMSPKGDVVATYTYKYDTNGHVNRNFFTIILAGTMRPLMMISPGTSSNLVHAFSNDSRFVAILGDDHVDIWNIFNLKKIMTIGIKGAKFDSIIRWSSNNNRLFVHTCSETIFICTETETSKKCRLVDDDTLDVVLNDDGRVAMILKSDEVSFINVNEDVVISSHELPITFSGTSLSYYHNDHFITIAGGFVIRTNPNETPVIIRDHRDKLELSMYSKKKIEYRRDYDWDPPHLWTHLKKLINGRAVFEYEDRVHGGLIRYSIDPSDMDGELSADVGPIEEDEPEDDFVIPEDNKDEMINPENVLRSGETLDAFYGGIIVRIRYVGYRGAVNFYVIQEYETNIPSHEGEIGFVKRGFMDKYHDLPKKLSGKRVDRPEYELITRDKGNEPCFYEVSPPIKLDIVDVPLYVDGRQNDLHDRIWMKIRDNDCPGYHISYLEGHDGSRNLTCKWYLTDGRKISEIPHPDSINTSLDDRGLYYSSAEGLYRLNVRECRFDLILSKEMIKINQLCIRDVTEHNGMIITTAENKKGLQLVSIKNGSVKVIRELDNNSSYCCACGKIIYNIGRTVEVMDLEQFKVLKTVNTSDYDKWMVMGVNNAGIVSLAKINLDYRNRMSMSAEVDFARMIPDSFDIEAYDAGHLSIEDTNNIAYSLDVKGNKIIFRSITDNPARLFALTYCLIKKNGVNKGSTLMPDISRFASNIIPVTEDRYVLVTDGIYETKKQGASKSSEAGDSDAIAASKNMLSEGIKKTRPLMRLMTAKDGRMVRLNKTRNTEGMMYGVKGYTAERSTVVSLKNGSFIAAEFSMQGSPVYAGNSIVTTRDISNGREYPEDGRINGKILGEDDESVTVGIIEKNGDSFIIRHTSRFNQYMRKIPNSDEILALPLVYQAGWRYQSRINYIELKDYSYNGKILSRAYVPGCLYGHYNREISPDRPLPLIIPLKIKKINVNVDTPCPLCRRLKYESAAWCETEVLLCTAFKGKIINTIVTGLTVPIDRNTEPMDGVIDTIEGYMSLGFTEGRYMITEEYCDDPGFPGSLWPYHAFSVDLDGNQIEIASDIVGPENDYYGSTYAVSIIGDKISYIRMNGNRYEHILLGSEHPIPVPGNNPHSLYRDERISVSYQGSEEEKLIITDGNKTVYLKCDLPPNFVESFTDNNGTVHLISEMSYRKEELIVPDGVDGTAIKQYGSNPGAKVYSLGKHRLHYCHGLFGVRI